MDGDWLYLKRYHGRVRSTFPCLSFLKLQCAELSGSTERQIDRLTEADLNSADQT